MTSTCQLCGLVITGREVAYLHTVVPQPTPEEQELQNFDLLAAAMLNHLGTSHQREAGAGIMAVAHLASKVYAMTLADSTMPRFRLLVKAWRTAIVTELAKDPTNQADAPAADDPAAGARATSTESESNEKKSERNAST